MKMLEPRIGPASAMAGTMMNIDLNIRWIFEHVLRNHGTREIVSRNDADGSLHRYTTPISASASRNSRTRWSNSASGPATGSRVSLRTRTGISSCITRCR